MDFIPEKISEYCEQHSSSESDVLNELNRYTNINVLRPRMLSGHLQGKFLGMVVSMLQPKNILEIGTYTGYSAIAMAEHLQEGGKIITVDVDEELSPIVDEFVQKANLKDKVELVISDATQFLENNDQEFDLVFIDADKSSYKKYYDLVFDSVPSGGYILVDNVLWSGKVVEELNPKDVDTKAIVEFNEYVQKDERVENLLLPFRDGLLLIKKK